MTDDAARAAQFVREVEGRLSALAAAEREEILVELAAHFADAARAGVSYEEARARLGSPREVARAYLLDAALTSTPSRTRLDATMRVIGVLSALGIPTIVITTVLAAVGTSLTVVGIGAFLAALLSPLFPPDLLPPDFRSREALLYGLPLAVVGVAALGGLVIYVRVMLRLLTQTARGLPLALDWSVLPPWARPRKRQGD